MDVSLFYSSFVRRTAQESGQVDSDAEIDRVEREADGMRIPHSKIHKMEGARAESHREAMVARDVRGASGFRRYLKHAAGMRRPGIAGAGAACLVIQESAENLLLPRRLDS